MWIIGCDYQPRMQEVALVNTETGEYDERQLNHSDGEAERFCRDLKQRGVNSKPSSAMSRSKPAGMPGGLQIGDPAQIKAARVRKQKRDREDARLLLKLLRENRFPRVWAPPPENRDLRQLRWHRHRLVQMRTRVMNQLQAIAMGEGVRLRKSLWSRSGRAKLESLHLAPWAAKCRQDLLELLDRLTPKIEELNVAVEAGAWKAT